MRAVFLDRDGVLNRDSADFIKTPDELHLLPGIPEAVARLNAAGFAAIVISNQSGLLRGLVTRENLEAIHARLRSILESAGASLTAIYYCPHLPTDGCACRKPAPGLVLQAAREHDVDLANSYFVGDREGDVACGAATGCRTVLVLSGRTCAEEAAQFTIAPDHICADLPAAVSWIVGMEKPKP